MQIIDEGMDKQVSDYATTLPIDEAKRIYTAYKNKELNIPFRVPDENRTERIMLGAAQRFGQSMEVIPEGIGIIGGQVGLWWGGIFKSVPLALPQAIGNEFTRAGEVFIDAANSSLEAKRKQQEQQLLPLSEEDVNSPLYKLTATGLDYTTQIALALTTGGTASLAAMGVRMQSETAVEGLEKYKKEHPEDKNLSGYKDFDNVSKELLLSSAKTAVNLYVERAIGVPKQVSQFKKALKTPSTGLIGMGKAVAKGYAMGFGEEWATETIQGITDTTFDAFLGRMKDLPELFDAYKQSINDAVYAGVFGGGFGASGHVIARGKAIGQVKQAMANVVPEQDLNNIATAIVDNHIAETKTMIATQLALSTQLRDKHGAIFNAMNVAAKQAMMNSGVTRTMTEDEIAQHSTELATLFADQVLAEANKRNVPIMDVIQDKDIVYDPETKELRLAPKQETFEIPERKTELGYDDLIEKLDKRSANAEEDDLDKMLDAEEERLKPFLDSAASTISKIEDEFGFDSSELNVIIRENKYGFNEYNEKFKKISENAWLQKELSEIGEKVKKEGDTRSPVEIGYDYVTNRVFDDFYDKVAKGKNFVLLQQSMDLAQEMANIDANNDEYTGETINIDGVEKPVYNSNGDRIAKSEEALRAFYKWFGDSKVVDEQGRPLVVYHNTDKNISVFDREKARTTMDIQGMFFAPKSDPYKEYGPIEYPVYLKIENPVDYAEAYKDFDMSKEGAGIRQREKLQQQGYDGVILTEDGKPYEFIAFEPNQIKSTSNRGAFDINNPNIYMQSAYAGSRVDYDRPSLEAIGSGEGNQAHGWGLYYALDRDVAENYREKALYSTTYNILDSFRSFTVDGKPFLKVYKVEPTEKLLSLLRLSNELGYNGKLLDYLESKIKQWKGFKDKGGNDNGLTEKYQKLYDDVYSKGSKLLTQGQVHEVDIPEPEFLLDEQKKYNDQSDYVKARLEDVFGSLTKEQAKKIVGDDKTPVKNMLMWKNGREIYNALSYSLGSDKEASKLLEANGIKGITYDGRQDGRCFVIFNPEDVKVIQKFYQGVANPKGMFDANSKVIKLFENADASTLDHELSHFWLDNMWTYATSGAASEAYKAQFQAVKDFLGVKPDQKYLTYNQHEKFASAYEKYIHRGIIPNSIMGNVFDNYERFIRNVYNSINDIYASTKQGKKKAFKLTPEIIKFFDSMIKGGVDTQAIEGSMAVEARNEEAQKADDTTMKEAKDVVEKEPVREVQPEIAPVKVEGETKESRLFNRLKSVAGAEGAVEYNVVNIREQREKASKMWKENPEKARAILKGTEQADDVLRQALYTEQQRLALGNGDTNTFLSSLRKQTAEATRMGQELSALRGVAEDITDPAYWIRSAETEALKNLAKKQTKNLENAVGNSPLMELTSRLDKDIKALQKDVMSKETDEEKMKALKEGVKSIADKYQGLEQPDTVFNQVDWDNEDFANDYIENKVKEKLGIALPKETAKAFIQTARDLDTLSKQRDEFGNPVEAFFVKKDELERMRNSHTPTSRTKILISTIGRGNMLTAPSTSVLNAVSNTQNYFVENVVRKVANILEGKTNDNIVDKDLMNKYRGLAWKTFWDTGYDMSFMTSLLDERLYKGESVSHSEGDGWIRGLGRWTEKYVFSRLISSPDIYFKSVLGFTNYLGNEATNIAYQEGLTGDKAKARANQLFRDAIKIEPETELGKQIRLKAQTDALILTFQQDTKFAEMLLKVRDAINKGTGDIGIGDIMSPFIKTPANILSMSFDAAVGPFASPVNLLGTLTDIKNKNYKSARVMQVAKQTTTAALAYVVIGLLASMLIDDDDYIPDYAQLTPKERAIVRAKGGSYGSIKVGDKYISTDFFGTFEMPLVTFLNARRTGNILKGIAGGVGAKFVDAPVLKDILGSSDAIKEMATSKDDIISAIGENVANAAISRLTPNALNAVAKVIDDKDRKINNVMDKVISRIPFARQTLDEKLNVTTGQAQELGRLNTILLGSRGKDETVNTLATELGRLAGVGEVVNITDPTKHGDLAKLSEKEKLRIQDIFAIEFAKKAGQLVRTSSYSGKSDENKKEALNKVRRDVIDDIKRKYRKEIKKAKK